MAYIDPITGAYVADSLDALPPGYNQPKAGNEANVAKMRAQLNSEEALRQQQLNEQAKSNYLSDPTGLAKFAMERMPGASFVQGVMPTLLAPFQLAGSAAYGIGNQVVNPQTSNFNADTAKAMRALQYTPPTQAGRDISEGIGKFGEAVGPLPELWVPQRGRGFTPDDLRVAGKMATEDFRNFGSDYANAKAGVQREYPTAGSRAAQFTDVAGDMVRPMAEKAYDMYMNPESSVEVYGMRPGANLSGLATAGGPMYAVKPRGGNWPTNLGSTLPLSEQGALGKHLSEVQYNDPLKVFEAQLKKHYPRGMDNRQLLADFDDYRTKRIGLALDPNSPDRYLSNEELGKKIADEFAELYNTKRIGAADINPDFDKQLHTASQIAETLPLYNSWVMGPYQKYITNQMGTGLATDPLLQAVNESRMPPHEIFGQEMPRDYEVESLQRNADRTRKTFVDNMFGYSDTPQRQEALQNTSVGKITATTPEGLAYENALDSSLYPKGPYAFKDKDNGTTQFPVVGKLDRNALISDFLTDPTEQTGFTPIRKQVFQDLLSGNISPDKLSNVTPATITRQMIKDKMAEFKEAQLNKKGAADWIPKRAAEMPTDMAFDDGSKMTVITPEIANADEKMTARDLGQITIDLNQCVGAGCHNTQDYSGHGPFLVPHTGKPPRGNIQYDKYDYLKRLKEGKTEIASLKDPKGVSQATIDLRLDEPKKISSSQKEFAVGVWLEDNKTPEDVREFYNNKMQHGIDMATVMAVKKFPELQTRLDNYNGSPKKSIRQMRGKNNDNVDEAYVPHLVQWLNKNADQLTDVSDLEHVPNVHDLTRSFDAVGRLMDKNNHWYSPTVEKFFDEMENENALPRFFTTDDFALKATERGVDLSAEPPRKEGEQYKYPEGATNYQKDLIDYFEPGAIRKSYGGYDRIISFDPNTNTVVASEVKLDENGRWIDHPTYGGPRSHQTMPSAIEFQKDMGRPMRNMRALDENELANAVQQMEPEVEQQLPFDRPEFPDALGQNMRDYFEGNAHNVPENMIEPYATETSILMGSQRPEAILPRTVHRHLVDLLLNQDQHTADIQELISQLQLNNHFMTEAQAENMLNMLISWTERFPLNE